MKNNLLFSVTLEDCDVHTFTVGENGGGKDNVQYRRPINKTSVSRTRGRDGPLE